MLVPKSLPVINRFYQALIASKTKFQGVLFQFIVNLLLETAIELTIFGIMPSTQNIYNTCK